MPDSGLAVILSLLLLVRIHLRSCATLDVMFLLAYSRSRAYWHTRYHVLTGILMFFDVLPVMMIRALLLAGDVYLSHSEDPTIFRMRAVVPSVLARTIRNKVQNYVCFGGDTRCKHIFRTLASVSSLNGCVLSICTVCCLTLAHCWSVRQLYCGLLQRDLSSW